LRLALHGSVESDDPKFPLGWLLDFRHCSDADLGRRNKKLGVGMLFMKNYVFKLGRKISNFSEVLRRFDTAQDVQHGVIGRVNGNGHNCSIPTLLSCPAR
jgi:hypothetical protein